MKLKFKKDYISLIIARIGLECLYNMYETLACRSSDVVRFQLLAFLQGQTMKLNFQRPLLYPRSKVGDT